MSCCQSYSIHSHQSHFGWDNSLAPVHRVASGDTIEFDTIDSSGGQITPETLAADIPHMDYGRFCPLSGPIWIDGARPGDVVKVVLLNFDPSGEGWTALIPGFGLLSDQFPGPALVRWKYDPVRLGPSLYGTYARIPLRPFVGTIGLAPAEKGWHSAIPPRRVGGNMDIRELTEGVQLYLPVEVDGALLSLGDTHAAQGEGEVCGTAIESRLKVTVRVELIKDMPLRFPRFTTPAISAISPIAAKGYEVTTGIGPDLMENARAAVSGMIDFLTRRDGISPEQAYMLCSVCGDLKISDIVDLPNWVVTFHLPRAIFE